MVKEKDTNRDTLCDIGFLMSKRFNKQERTDLFAMYPEIDLQINNRKLFQRKSFCFKSLNLLPLFVSFQIPKDLTKNKIRLELKNVEGTTIPSLPLLVNSHSHPITVTNHPLLQKKEYSQILNLLPLESLSREPSFNIYLLAVFDPVDFFDLDPNQFPNQRFSYKNSFSFSNSFSKKIQSPLKTQRLPFIKNRIKNKIIKIISEKSHWGYGANLCFSKYYFSLEKGELIENRPDNASLFLTDLDIRSYKIEETKPKFHLNQFIRYGEELTKGFGFPESGQVIQVEKNKLILRRALPILCSKEAILRVTEGNLIKRGQPLLTFSYEKVESGDIIQGIPKIEQIFEARQTKEGLILPSSLPQKLSSYFARYEKMRHVFQEKATRRGIIQFGQLLVRDIQRVYLSQGVTIAEKHLEVVARQMISKVRIVFGGDLFVQGELIDRFIVEKSNFQIKQQFTVFYCNTVRVKSLLKKKKRERKKKTLFRYFFRDFYSHTVRVKRFKKKKKKKRERKNATLFNNSTYSLIRYQPIILGITRASLEAESFISAASFQESTRVLTNAAILGQTDFLCGLKERVILGDLIPIGTGALHLYREKIFHF